MHGSIKRADLRRYGTTGRQMKQFKKDQFIQLWNPYDMGYEHKVQGIYR